MLYYLTRNRKQINWQQSLFLCVWNLEFIGGHSVFLRTCNSENFGNFVTVLLCFKNWNWELFFNQFLKSVCQLLITFCGVWHFHRFLIPHFDNFLEKLRRLSQIWRIYGAQKNVLQNFRQLMETLGACVQAYHVIIWNTRTPNVPVTFGLNITKINKQHWANFCMNCLSCKICASGNLYQTFVNKNQE